MAVKTDWEEVRSAYERGGASYRALGSKFGVTGPAIRYHAVKDGWIRVLPTDVVSKVMTRQVKSRRSRPEPALTQAIEASGVDPRAVLASGLSVAQKLVTELKDTTDFSDEVEKAILDYTKDDLTGQRRSRMLAAVSLPSRSQTLKNLVLAAKIVSDANPVGKKGVLYITAERFSSIGFIGRWRACAQSFAFYKRIAWASG
jgi:hypothetical protein